MKWLLLLALAACGSKSDSKTSDKPAADDKVASCNQATAHACREYRGDNLALGTDSIKKLCEAGAAIAPSTFALTACPTDKVSGTCSKPEGKDFFYDGYPIAMADAEKQCKDGGGTFGK